MINRWSSRRVAVHAALAIALWMGYAVPGFAYKDGIFGLSGKSNGFYCATHHGGGVVPTVAVDGPSTLEPGAIATFHFTVTSHAASQIAAGLDVAGSGGALGAVDEVETRLDHGEITHNAPKDNDANGVASFAFTWTAPTTPGIYTLYAAGTSVNLNNLDTGDGAARTTYEVAVGVAPNTPTPTPAPPTPTATATTSAPSCIGDCGGDGEVTVNELIIGVNIALGVTPVSACPVFDANGDGEVTIDELIRGVNFALTACPA